ncbi:MAG: fumarylacetoacetate hydrolase family protein [Saprospiraceae bacterium]|nr:fumarylacetoacetate hydrolase family protein [Candidatus Vicinibacter affinis]
MTIFCIGRNYLEHAKELNNPVPIKPVIFCKPSTALLRENKAFYLPDLSKDIHHEIETVLRISKPGQQIPLNKAVEHYSHIGLGIDFTARDLQQECKNKGLPWEIAKAFDNSAVLSDFIDKKEFDLQNIEFSLLKNKELVQSGNTREMIFSFSEIISYLSTYFRLNAGDLIYTGTPSGVGSVQSGDFLEGFIGDRRMFWTEIR